MAMVEGSLEGVVWMNKLILLGLLLLCTGLVSAFSCYQESANVTNQTGIDGFCGLNYNGSYGVIQGTVYPVYVKPLGATGAVWIAKIANGTMVYMPIPHECWIADPLTVNFSMTGVHWYTGSYNPSLSYVVLNCFNGSNYITIGSQDTVHNSMGGTTGAFISGPDPMFDGDWNTLAFNLEIPNAPYWNWATNYSAPYDGITEYSYIWEEAMNWTMCDEVWVQHNSSCNGKNYTISYNDTAVCGSTTFLPLDNSSIINCSLPIVRHGGGSSGGDWPSNALGEGVKNTTGTSLSVVGSTKQFDFWAWILSLWHEVFG